MSNRLSQPWMGESWTLNFLGSRDPRQCCFTTWVSSQGLLERRVLLPPRGEWFDTMSQACWSCLFLFADMFIHFISFYQLYHFRMFRHFSIHVCVFFFGFRLAMKFWEARGRGGTALKPEYVKAGWLAFCLQMPVVSDRFFASYAWRIVRYNGTMLYLAMFYIFSVSVPSDPKWACLAFRSLQRFHMILFFLYKPAMICTGVAFCAVRNNRVAMLHHPGWCNFAEGLIGDDPSEFLLRFVHESVLCFAVLLHIATSKYVPLARFGHTTTFVGDNRVVLFGGATGDTGSQTASAWHSFAEKNIVNEVHLMRQIHHHSRCFHAECPTLGDWKDNERYSQHLTAMHLVTSLWINDWFEPERLTSVGLPTSSEVIDISMILCSNGSVKRARRVIGFRFRIIHGRECKLKAGHLVVSSKER